ncbi:MAG: hypothetical protein R2710_09525 [Acidimicrobiales bacterium]
MHFVLGLAAVVAFLGAVIALFGSGVFGVVGLGLGEGEREGASAS